MWMMAMNEVQCDTCHTETGSFGCVCFCTCKLKLVKCFYNVKQIDRIKIIDMIKTIACNEKSKQSTTINNDSTNGK